jgi:putative oxidoreductase
MVMHRLFSSFPNSFPGAALLLLRLCVSTVAATEALCPAIGSKAPLPALTVAAWISAALILVGLWTRMAAGVSAVADGIDAIADASGVLEHLTVGAIAVSLMLSGPGAWSMDALLHGRRRLM